ncbi:hypothetical protein NFI96_031479 [Prochilodus magdalenae]|nr:hypothetical protein NFI96_031479 [Prochilodus magdalenae]
MELHCHFFIFQFHLLNTMPLSFTHYTLCHCCSSSSLSFYYYFIGALEIHLSLLPVDGSLLILLGDISLPSNKLKSSFLEPLLSSFNLTFTSLLRCTKLDILDLIFSRPTRMRWISKTDARIQTNLASNQFNQQKLPS